MTALMAETTTRRLPTLAELRGRRDEILKIASRYGVFNIRVFGSVARGDATDSSDVDLLVDIEDGRSLFDLGAFYMDLRDLLGYEIDLGTEVKPRLRADVDAEAVPL
jgi:predicted nucleotidyltransferase